MTVAVLLVLVAIASLQSVLATNHAPQQVVSTTTEVTTETATVTITANPNQVQPLSQYGVVRLQTTALNNGRTLYVGINSTVGPIYLEQLQIFLSSQQSQPLMAAEVFIGGLNGAACSGTIIPAGQSYGELNSTMCPGTSLIDPLGNLAIVAAAGTSNALSMQPVANEPTSSSISGQVIVIATLCAPITAKVTLTPILQ